MLEEVEVVVEEEDVEEVEVKVAIQQNKSYNTKCWYTHTNYHWNLNVVLLLCRMLFK